MNKPILRFLPLVLTLLLLGNSIFSTANTSTYDANTEVVCEIFDMTATPSDCNSDGQFFVVIDFEFVDVSGVGFSLAGNGADYGNFQYSSLPVTLGPFTGGDGTMWEFIAIDADSPNCSDFVDLGLVACSDCDITVVETDVICDNGGTPDDPSDDSYSFTIFVDGDNVGSSYSFFGVVNQNNLPYGVVNGPYGPLDCDGNLTFLEILDDDTPNCFELGIVYPGGCCGSPCDVDNLVIETLSETADGTLYEFSYHANAPPPGTLGFDLTYNGVAIGFYPYSQLPAQFFVPCSAGVPGILTACDNDTNCCRDFFIDLPGCDTSCDIYDMVAEALPCTPNGVFSVVLDFEYDFVGNNGFSVVGNGNNYGSFEYANLPITINGIPGDGSTIYEFIALDNDSTGCAADVEIGPISCPIGVCVISDLIVEAYECDSDGQFLVDLDFNHAGTSNFFKVFVNGEFYGEYLYTDLFITIGPFPGNGSAYIFEVQDGNHPDCGDIYTLESPNCDGDCEIWDLEYELISDNADGSLFLLNFNHANTSNVGFDVFYNGEFIEFYSYNDLPVEVFIPCSLGTPGELKVCDNDNLDCCATIDLELNDCQNACEIWDLIVEPYDCDAEGQFLVDLDFNFANTSDFFKVFVNGEFYGEYLYSDLFLTIGSFPGDNSLYVIEVQDGNNPNCGQTITLQSPDCGAGGACEIWDLIAEPHECDPITGEYLVDIDFNYANTSPDGFKVKFGSDVYGPFSYADLPITIGPYPGDGTDYTVIIKDVDDGSCSATYLMEGVNCEPECAIWDLEATPDCNAEGDYVLLVNFNYGNVGDSGFNVYYGGSFIGNYGYDEVPILIGTFPGDGSENTLVIRDADINGCKATLDVEPIICTDECTIFNLTIEAACDPSNDTYSVTIDFDYVNPGNDFFEVSDANGTILGLFELADLPIVIEGYSGPPSSVQSFEVCINDMPDCCATASFDLPDCDAQCSITDLEIVNYECDSEGNGFLVLNMNYDNVGGAGFTLFFQGQAVGVYDYVDLPITYGPFMNSDPTWKIQARDNEIQGCKDKIIVDALICPLSPLVWPGDANDNNTANNFDLLNIGIAYGSAGPERLDNTISWDGKVAEDWSESFTGSGSNYKHADTNGDGFIDDSDIAAILENYNEISGPVEAETDDIGSPTDPPVYVDLPEPGEVVIGQPFFADIMIGTGDIPVEEFYGLAFTLQFDPTIINPASVDIEFGSSWAGTPGFDLLVLSKVFATEGYIDLALVRNDQNEVTGGGMVATFVGIIDDVLGKVDVEIEVASIKMIKRNEQPIPVQLPKELMEIHQFDQQFNERVPEVGVFPNPNTGIVFLQVPENLEVLEWEVMDARRGIYLGGQHVNGSEINLENLPAGLYLLRLKTNKGVQMKRITKK